MRSDAKRFENWEQFFAGKAVLGVAINCALALGTKAIQERIYYLSARLREKLSLLDGVTLTDEGQEKCCLITFTAEQKSASEIQTELSATNINVSVAGYSWNLASFKDRGLTEAVRLSVHYFNTDEEIDVFEASLKKIFSAA